MTQLTIQQAFALAMQHHQAGRLGEAEQIYRQILTQEPRHVDALHLLGVIAHQAGRDDIAVELIRQAIAIMPTHAEAHSNLGVALSQMEQLDQAIAAYHRAIELNPNYAQVHFNLGNALSRAGRVDEAMAAYQWAIAIRPNYAEAYANLGNNLRKKGQLDEAVVSYRQAIALKPKDGETLCSLGQTLLEKDRSDEAIAAFRQAIEVKPNYAEAHLRLGNALLEKQQLDEAIAAYERAISLNPNLLEARHLLGNVLSQQGRLDEAIATFRQAIAAPSDAGEGPNKMAAPASQSTAEMAAVHSTLVGMIHLDADYDAAMLLQENQQWAARYEAPLAREIREHDNNRDPERRLKIGYVSPDFRWHASACFLLPLLANHDPGAVEIYCYANVKREDRITEKFKHLSGAWRNCAGISDAEMAETIRSDGIDILVDLALHSPNNRLLVFARKPAPVQVTWLAYPGTTGMSSIDYRLTDRFLDPVGQTDQYYSERSIRLPNSFWCYQPLAEESPEVNELPALGNGYMTFGCFNNLAKVTPQTLRLWMRVLKTIGNSRLIVAAQPGSHRERIKTLFEEGEIAPNRVEFVPRASLREYLKYHHRVDLCLDPVPYPGVTSSLDALWMGVPSVTLSGNTAASRGGESILCNVGLPEMVARSSDEYVAIAARLSSQLDRLSELRRSLRGMLQGSPLMDGRRFAAGMESAFRQMWRAWCSGGKETV